MTLWLSQYAIKLSYFTLNSSRKFFIHKVSLQPSVIPIYSASVVDKTTHYWSLDCHETAPPAKVNKYLDMNFLELTSLAISTSVYTCNTCLSLPKHKHVLEVPLRYLRIHFTIVQCSLPGLERNWLTTPTGWVISGLYKPWRISNYQFLKHKELLSSLFLFLTRRHRRGDRPLQMACKWRTNCFYLTHVKSFKNLFNICFLK